MLTPQEPAWLGASVNAAAAVLLLAPLIGLTRAGYRADLWWRRCETDLLPFPSRVTVRLPLFSWYLALWVAAWLAVSLSLGRGSTAMIGGVAAVVEIGYALRRRGLVPAPLPPAADRGTIAFGLGQNALTEELLFRGLPLGAAALTGASRLAPWPPVYVVGTALAFGCYHVRMGQRDRFADTSLYGVVLAAIALWQGLAAAILLHALHNALAVPLGTSRDLQGWSRRRRLTMAALAALGLAWLAYAYMWKGG